jgi:predicted enzyme related to lactoylglutathione lyase
MAETHHHISYVEIPAPDLAAAKAFYGAAFGWTFTDYGDAYVGIRAPDGEGEVGGLSPVGDPVRGALLVLLFSDDLDASVAAVEEAGGTVVQGPYPYPGGRRFHFTDPAGNELGVYAHG